MSTAMILAPLFAQVLLTFAVMIGMMVHRGSALMSGTTRYQDIAMREPKWPYRAALFGNSFSNQFELPVLFYAVVAFALITKGADTLMIVLAWLFALTRVLHAAIHIGPNKVRWRSPAFALGFLIVAAMWVKLALHVASGGTV